MNSILHIQAAGEAATILVTEIIHSHHIMYKVTMESGYTNIFYTDVETGKWMEEDLGFTDLASQVGKEIRTLKLTPLHVSKYLTWHTMLIRNKPVSFGFFSFLNGDQKMFEIYRSNKKYMYTLVEAGAEDWRLLDQNDIDIAKVDSNFVEHIIKVFPTYAYLA